MYVLGAGWGLHTTALREGLGRWGSRVAKGNSLRHPLTVPVPLEGWIAHTQKGWCSTPARTPTIFTIQQVKSRRASFWIEFPPQSEPGGRRPLRGDPLKRRVSPSYL